jgi:predicted Zn-dependent protease
MEPRRAGGGRSRGLGVVALALGVAGCATVPYTNRTQLILVSQREETRLGAQAFQGVLAKSRIERQGVAVERVTEVGRRIAAAAAHPDFRWEFVVIDDPKLQNAFCLPGGKVAVYTGILPTTRDTAGLAVVLGHEIAHAIARHGAERMSQEEAVQAVGAAISIAGGQQSGALLGAYGLGAQLGVLLPFSRAHESEADHIGLILMAKAGYDPRTALEFWRRMERSGGGGSAEFLSTHPSHGTREAQLAEWMPEAVGYYERAAKAPVEPLS